MGRSPIRRLLRRGGIDVVRYPIHTTRAGHLRWVLNAQGVTTVLDVGANRGQFAKELRTESRFTGRIVSFEPEPETAARLEQTAAVDTKWSVHACALGDHEGTAELRRFASSDWNSLHDVDDERLAESGRAVQRRGSVTCAVRRLDAMWDDIVQRDDTVFLKSDTQGHDLAVLAGAGDHLGSVAGLLLEASIHTFYEGEADLREVLRVVREYGLEPSGFFPVARAKGSLALDTIDVCFVRADNGPRAS
jgi:FkbM family methyltransferase